MSKPKGQGFWAHGMFYLKRCYDCGRENWAPAVARGQCAWCGSEKHPNKNSSKQSNTKVVTQRGEE